MNRLDKENRNRLSWWFPRLPGHILTPRTAILPYSGQNLLGIFDGEVIGSDFNILCDDIIQTGNLLGWPLFLRTDYLSGKHSWKDTCFVNDAACVPQHVIKLVESSAVADMCGFPADCWAVRQLLKTEPVFFAFHGDMPITKERRYFVEDGKVICHHPYWPCEAFNNSKVSKDNWVKCLNEMNYEDCSEVDLLTVLSEDIGKAIGGSWSIDWLFSNGYWYMIDMAEANKSYHWSGCPFGRINRWVS